MSSDWTEETIDRMGMNSNILKRIRRDRTEPILYPWLSPGTLAMVYSRAGVGKSFFLMSVCEAIVNNVPLGPWEVREPTNILYIDGENSLDVIQERFSGLEDGVGESEDFNIYVIAATFTSFREQKPLQLHVAQDRQAVYDWLVKAGELSLTVAGCGNSSCGSCCPKPCCKTRCCPKPCCKPRCCPKPCPKPCPPKCKCNRCCPKPCGGGCGCASCGCNDSNNSH